MNLISCDNCAVVLDKEKVMTKQLMRKECKSDVEIILMVSKIMGLPKEEFSIEDKYMILVQGGYTVEDLKA